MLGAFILLVLWHISILIKALLLRKSQMSTLLSYQNSVPLVDGKNTSLTTFMHENQASARTVPFCGNWISCCRYGFHHNCSKSFASAQKTHTRKHVRLHFCMAAQVTVTLQFWKDKPFCKQNLLLNLREFRYIITPK